MSKWSKHKPETVVEHEQSTTLCNIPTDNDREIAANKPDIIIRDQANKKCQNIDIAFPSDINTSVKPARMWKQR